jgi:hypothetical protein
VKQLSGYLNSGRKLRQIVQVVEENYKESSQGFNGNPDLLKRD